MKLKPSQFLGPVLELEFSCSLQQIFLYLENIPPMPLSQYQYTRKHKCKLEVGSHNETSSLVHTYNFLNDFVFDASPVRITNTFSHPYLIILFYVQLFSSFISWSSSTSMPLYLFVVESFQGLYLYYCIYVLFVSLEMLRYNF